MAAENAGAPTRAGYIEVADRQTVVLAETGDIFAGHCLWGNSGQFVRIAHLCVARQYRGMGLAQLHVKDVEAYHPHASGIRLKRRRDRPAAGHWPVLVSDR